MTAFGRGRPRRSGAGAGLRVAHAPLAALLDLSGRTAVVTGGAMGIGLGIARRLHEAGASLLVADLD